MTIFEKLGTDNKRTIINVLRKRYASMEEAYLFELDKEPEKCYYCNNTAGFISIFKGYRKHCGAAECHNKNVIDTNRNLAKTRIKYVSKICLICDRQIDNMRVKNAKFPVCEDSYCQQNKNKPFLKEKRIPNFRTDLSYLNKLAFELAVKYGCKRAKRILYKNLVSSGVDEPNRLLKNKIIDGILSVDFNTSDFVLTNDNNYYVKLKDPYLTDTLQKLYGDSYSYFLETYYPELHSNCVICNAKFQHTNPYKTINFKSVHTCSIECYRKNFKFYITDERKRKHSETTKRKILNNEWTPNVFNSYTKMNILLKTPNGELKFRSTWELVFFIMSDYKEDLQYEKLRLPYILNGKQYTYLVDFIDDDRKVVYEIKPTSMMTKEKNKIKQDILSSWCTTNGYKMIIVSEKDINQIKFDDFVKTIEHNFYIIDNKHLTTIKKYLK